MYLLFFKRMGSIVIVSCILIFPCSFQSDFARIRQGVFALEETADFFKREVRTCFEFLSLARSGPFFQNLGRHYVRGIVFDIAAPVPKKFPSLPPSPRHLSRPRHPSLPPPRALRKRALRSLKNWPALSSASSDRAPPWVDTFQVRKRCRVLQSFVCIHPQPALTLVIHVLCILPYVSFVRHLCAAQKATTHRPIHPRIVAIAAVHRMARSAHTARRAR